MSTIGIWNTIHHSVSSRKYSSNSNKLSDTKESTEEPYISPGFSFDPKRREENMARIRAENAKLAGLDNESGESKKKSYRERMRELNDKSSDVQDNDDLEIDF